MFKFDPDDIIGKIFSARVDRSDESFEDYINDFITGKLRDAQVPVERLLSFTRYRTITTSHEVLTLHFAQKPIVARQLSDHFILTHDMRLLQSHLELGNVYKIIEEVFPDFFEYLVRVQNKKIGRIVTSTDVVTREHTARTATLHPDA